MSAPSLEDARATASQQPNFNACYISMTGSDTNGKALHENVVNAVREELANRQADCDPYVDQAIALRRSQMQAQAIRSQALFECWNRPPDCEPTTTGSPAIDHYLQRPARLGSANDDPLLLSVI